MLAAGVIAGIASSVLFNLGIAQQAIEARRTPATESLRLADLEAAPPPAGAAPSAP